MKRKEHIIIKDGKNEAWTKKMHEMAESSIPMVSVLGKALLKEESK